MGPSRAEQGGLGLSGVGRGWECIGIQIKDKAKWGRVGPVRAEWGLVGPSRAE